MREAGYAFEVKAADVDETPPEGKAPEDAAVEVARRKAEAVAKLEAGKVVVGADTIVVSAAGRVLGKPDDDRHAREMLGELSGTAHTVITGVYIVDTLTGMEVGRAVSTGIVFAEMSEADIHEYVSSGEATGKAGAYAIQETADRFVRDVRGSFTNVVGLPMEALGEMLEELDASGRRRGGQEDRRAAR